MSRTDSAAGSGRQSWEEQVQVWQERHRSFLEAQLAQAGPSERLEEALRYALYAPGKRVRPVLLYAAAQTLCPEPRPEQLASLDCLAAALECVHAYSLVHDDLPCMDDDELRRGRPCCHVVYGEATALLVGDALQAEAMELLLKASQHNVLALAAAQVVAEAAGRKGMVGGQQLDLEGEQRRLRLEELEAMVQGKTAALIRAALMAGALAVAPVAEPCIEVFSSLGRSLGRAFQIRDDILDVEADPELLGKSLGKDEAQNKSSYVRLLGLEGARRAAEDSEQQAQAALEALEQLGYNLSFLRAYTAYLAQRRS